MAKYGLSVDEVEAKRLLWVVSRISGQRVLDYGFGNGSLHLLLGEKDVQLLTVLPSGANRLHPPVQEYIHREKPFRPAQIYTGPLFRLPGADHSVDTLVGGSLLTDGAALSVLPELQRVLQPNGKLILCLPFPRPEEASPGGLFSFYALLSYVQKAFLTRDIRLEGGYFHYVGRLRRAEEEEGDEKLSSFFAEHGSPFFPGTALQQEHERLQREYLHLKAEREALQQKVEELTRRLKKLEESRLIRLGLKLTGGWEETFTLPSSGEKSRPEGSPAEPAPAGAGSDQPAPYQEKERPLHERERPSSPMREEMGPGEGSGEDAPGEGDLLSSLALFLDRVKAKGGPLWVLVAPGGRWEEAGPFHRAGQLAARLLKKEVPILYLYEEGEEAPPVYAGNFFWQAPLSFLSQVAGRAESFIHQLKPVLYVGLSHITCARLINRLHLAGWLTVYDPDPLTKEEDPVHDYLLHQASRVMVRSPLQQKRLGSRLSARPVLIPHRTIPIEELGVLSGKRVPLRENRPGGGRPVVGVVGPVDGAWFDQDLFYQLAAERPGWRFELAGVELPYRLHPFPNVASYPLDRGLRRMQRWSCAIFPVKKEALEGGFWPPQLDFCLQAGLAVVTSPLNGLAALPSVWQAETIKEWLKGMEEAASCPPHSIEASLQVLGEEDDPLDRLVADGEKFYETEGSGTIWAWLREAEKRR